MLLIVRATCSVRSLFPWADHSNIIIIIIVVAIVTLLSVKYALPRNTIATSRFSSKSYDLYHLLTVFSPLIPITAAPRSLLPGFTLFSSHGLSYLHFSMYKNSPKFLNCMFLVQVFNFLHALFTFTFNQSQVILMM